MSSAATKELDDRYRDGERHGRRAAIEVCAAEVERQGCNHMSCGMGKAPGTDHSRKCPIGLAARLRGLA